jgi:hypothetical protein
MRGVLVEGLDELLVLLLVMLAAGVESSGCRWLNRPRPACGVRFPACTPASMSRTRVPAAAAIAGTGGCWGW